MFVPVIHRAALPKRAATAGRVEPLCELANCPARSGRFIEPDQPDATRPVVLEKIFRFHARPNHRYQLAHPPRQEGRIAIVTDAGLDAVDAAASGAIVVAGRVLP
jgi:hypothetical protein